MTKTNQMTTINLQNLVKRALQGMGIALILLAMLLIIIGEIESWIYIPLLTVSIGGAGGGIFYYLLVDMLLKENRYKLLGKICCAVFFLIGFWLSLVFGLAQVGLWD